MIFHLLEAEVHELQPQPGSCQHQYHVGEGEAKPASKVDYVSITREESMMNMKKGASFMLVSKIWHLVTQTAFIT